MMQPIKRLSTWLANEASEKNYLFTTHGLRSLFPTLTDASFKTLLSRAAESEVLIRVARGLYLYQPALPADGLLLFHIANILRANEFNYISLETALSDAGVISQIPTHWITIMTSGRNNTIQCSHYGSIEFIHTNQKATEIMHQLTYDHACGMWRASIKQALRDMKATKRNLDLIDWTTANELI